MSVDPIAVIGMGCRLPMAPDPDSFWDLLREGRSAIGEVPASRWDAGEFHSPEARTPGKTRTRWGAFLDDVYGFDPLFFRIMPAEAPRIDPQQRLVLEVAWEALEHAGIDPTQLAGSLTGVYVGISHSDHDRLLYQDRSRIDGYNGPNTYHCFVANRLSYFLKLRGPSLAVDGACSSSLAAVHLACQALRCGDCDLALAGGVNVNLTPDEFIALSFLGVLSAGDRCSPFAAGADGYVRGEGCGVVVLKRLEDARRDRDNILAVIRGSALNHNGLSNGITAPSGAAQEEVIRRALANAGVDAGEIGHLEGMGTGTDLGDSIEISALAATYGSAGAPGPKVWVSSVKANIGHLEAASGVASLIKVILSLQQARIPPQINIDALNPRIDLGGTRLDFPRICEPWRPTAGKRLAALSAFGFGGANAHLILEEGCSRPAANGSRRPLHLLTLSARTEQALSALARRYAHFLNTHPELDIADVCYTSNVGRTHWPWRLAAVAASTEQLKAQLSAYGRNEPAPGVLEGKAEGANGEDASSWPAAAAGSKALPPAGASSLEGWKVLLLGVAQRYVRGGRIDWSHLEGSDLRRRLPLPTYPFERVPCRLNVG